MIDHLLQILMLHQGRDKAISADRLMQTLRTYGDEVPDLPAMRGIVHAARKRGHLIASCQGGYFLPTSRVRASASLFD